MNIDKIEGENRFIITYDDDPDRTHLVDLDTEECSCMDYQCRRKFNKLKAHPRNIKSKYCKHLYKCLNFIKSTID